MKIKTNEELWEILGSVEKFNAFIKQLTIQIHHQCMMAIPALVLHHIKNEGVYKDVRDKFWFNNPELVDYKKVVAEEIEKISSANSDWDIEKVFHAAGISAKKRIKEYNERIDHEKTV